MLVEASPEALALIAEQGGKLYVHARRTRCCSSAITLLETACEPGSRRFNRFDAGGVEVYLDAALTPPEKLELDVAGFRRKTVRAYWNGCAYVV